MFRSPRPARLSPFGPALAFVLAACSPADPNEANLDTLDAELTDANAAAQPGRDPALMSALQDQIMVDPALAQHSNADAVRPTEQAYAAPVPAEAVAAPEAKAKPATGPLIAAPAPKKDCPQCEIAKQSVTLGGLAARQKSPRTAQCVGGMRYSAAWGARLPADLPLFPDARLIEAAGNAANGCALRAVTFTTAADLQQVLDFYYTRASQAGYSAEHQGNDDENVIGGVRNRDGGAFVLFARKRDGGGTEADLIANTGR